MLLLLLYPATLMFPPQPLILLWWCHPYGRCVVAVMQPHLPTFSLVLFGCSWSGSVVISFLMFPPFCTGVAFYPLLCWKRWMSPIDCSSLATASSSLTHSFPSSLSLYCLFSPPPLISLSLSHSLSLHTTPPPCVLPHFCSYCALLLTYALLPPSLPSCPILPVCSELWTIFVTFLWLFHHGPGGAASLFSPEFCLWQFEIMHFGCVDSCLLITWVCTLLEYFNMLRLVTKSIWLTTEPVGMLSTQLMPENIQTADIFSLAWVLLIK